MTKAHLISRILDGLIYLMDGNITKEEAIDSIEKLIDEYTKKKIEQERTEERNKWARRIKTVRRWLDKERNKAIEMLNNLPENRPLYKDSGLWQIRSDDMDSVIFQQGVNESLRDFIIRVTQLKEKK